MDEYKPQEGIWTLIAPDGRQWHGASGLLAAAAEQNERIPPEVQMARLMSGADDTRPRYENVSCSQCGRDFGPGDSGFSHCENHKQR